MRGSWAPWRTIIAVDIVITILLVLLVTRSSISPVPKLTATALLLISILISSALVIRIERRQRSLAAQLEAIGCTGVSYSFLRDSMSCTVGSSGQPCLVCISFQDNSVYLVKVLRCWGQSKDPGYPCAKLTRWHRVLRVEEGTYYDGSVIVRLNGSHRLCDAETISFSVKDPYNVSMVIKGLKGAIDRLCAVSA